MAKSTNSAKGLRRATACKNTPKKKGQMFTILIPQEENPTVRNQAAMVLPFTVVPGRKVSPAQTVPTSPMLRKVPGIFPRRK